MKKQWQKPELGKLSVDQTMLHTSLLTATDRNFPAGTKLVDETWS